MPTKHPASPADTLALNRDRCHFTTIDDHRCRMHRAARHKTLCLTHAKEEQQLIDTESVAAELIGPVQEYQNAISVNRALGCLFNLVAQKRISRKDGALLAFIGQMMLHSIGSTVKDEFIRMSGEHNPKKWEANIRKCVEIMTNDFSRKPPQPTDPSDDAGEESA